MTERPPKYRWILADHHLILESCDGFEQGLCKEAVSKKVTLKSFEEELYQLYRIPGGAPPESQLRLQKFPAAVVKKRGQELSHSFERLQRWQSVITGELQSQPQTHQDDHSLLDAACYHNNELWRKGVSAVVRKYSGRWWSNEDELTGMLRGYFEVSSSSRKGLFFVTKDDWLRFMGDGPYRLTESDTEITGISPMYAEIFLAKTGGHARFLRPNDWFQALKENPRLCRQRVWLKKSTAYALSPKCSETAIREREPWVSIRRVKLLFITPE